MFTLSDFALDASYDLAIAKLLSRMTAAGEIKESLKVSIISQSRQCLVS